MAATTSFSLTNLDAESLVSENATLVPESTTGITNIFTTTLPFDVPASHSTHNSVTTAKDFTTSLINSSEELSTNSFERIVVCNMTFDLVPGEFILHDYFPRAVLAILILIIFIVGVSGNLLVVAAVIVSKKLQTATNVFVINLAVADLITNIFLPVHASTLLSQNSCYIPDVLCKFVAAATLIALGSSVLTLAMIAYNRYHTLSGVLRPTSFFGKNIFTARNMVLMVMFTWLYPILLMCIIVPLGLSSLGYSLQYKVCLQNSDNEYSDYMTLTVCLLVQFPSFIAIISCYLQILILFRRQRRDMDFHLSPSPVNPSRPGSRVSMVTVIEDDSEVSESTSQPPFEPTPPSTEAPSKEEAMTTEYSKGLPVTPHYEAKNTEISADRPRDIEAQNGSHKSAKPKVTLQDLAEEKQYARYREQIKITANLFLVVCAYTICVMPAAVAYLIPSSDPAIPWLTILFLCNSCVNPVIYALRHPTFSAVFTSMLKCRYRDIQEPSSFLRSCGIYKK